MGLTRALLESRASEFRLRIPLEVDRGKGRGDIAEALEGAEISPVFPLLEGRSPDGREVDLCWLDWIQLKAVGEEMATGFARDEGAVAVAGLEIAPVYAPAAGPSAIKRSWQYWNSRWQFANPSSGQNDLWRVRPNDRRDRPEKFLSRLRRNPQPGFGPQARGTFAACMHREMRRERLGGANYAVIKHPYRQGWLPIRILEEIFDEKEGEEGGDAIWRDAIFLDRTARDALGIGDGEFCHVYPWLYPRYSVWSRRLRDWGVGARTIAAHPRAPARADLEKPVCRLEPAALEAIGGRAGDVVTIEHVAPPQGEGPGERWDRVRMRQRVLPIDALERAERSSWEGSQAWDEGPATGPPAKTVEGLELEGYVDCAERLGVYPPYPTIYLNYYSRQHRLRKLGLCQPVLIRVGAPGRLMAEASEFAWLVVIALLGATIAFVSSKQLQILAMVALALATLALLAFRAIRSIR